ncbi:amidohydrolase [Eisenibacter elegans]|jgi:predicted amidohydrolase|uniref:amidohydrolase n=1 Tax=Eisenibacter elegans TaxID=997 RepID=UPI00040170D8|nr:amidohydrolase [Eisenibacter elegans]
MSQNLTLALIQSDLYWHEPEANRAMFEEKIAQLPQGVEVIVLPEMFTTGFTMEATPNAEPMNLHTFKWMTQQAARSQAAVVGSYIVQEQGRFYNRMLWMQPDGGYQYYDKRHLFRMAQEHETFSAGQQPVVVEWRGWRILLQVCYDLRFPVFSRNRPELNYDLALYVANWPAARSNAWDILLQARAVENLAYVVGVNRIGTDGKGIDYCGNTALVDFKGERLCYHHHGEAASVHTLSKAALTAFRDKFPAHLDADRFELK